MRRSRSVSPRVGAAGSLLLVVLAGAVLGTGPTGDAVGQPSSASAVVARVGREAVTTQDLAAFFFERNREGWSRAVASLVDERIVAHEVSRLGLSVPRDVLAKALTDEVAAREKALKETYGDEIDLAEEVRRGYGLDLERWKAEILVPRLRTQLLLQRVVRLDTRRRERVQARVIVVADEAKAQGLRRRVESGADFSLLALQESIDPTAQAGGQLPAIARGDLTLPDVEARLFEARPGSLVGPLPVTLEGETTWHLYKVITRTQPWGGTRGELLARLETDLAETPLDRSEFDRWRARMRRDFRVQVYDPSGRALPDQ